VTSPAASPALVHAVHPPPDGTYRIRTTSHSDDAPSDTDGVSSHTIKTVDREQGVTHQQTYGDDEDVATDSWWRADGVYRSFPSRADQECEKDQLLFRLPMAIGTAWTSTVSCDFRDGTHVRESTDWKVVGEGTWRLKGQDYFVWRIDRVATNTSSFDGTPPLEPAVARGHALFAPEIGTIVHMEHSGTSSYSNRPQTHYVDTYDLLNAEPE
jgi:hypothetical protein